MRIKRATRERMVATGEQYAAARMAVLRERLRAVETREAERAAGLRAVALVAVAK